MDCYNCHKPSKKLKQGVYVQLEDMGPKNRELSVTVTFGENPNQPHIPGLCKNCVVRVLEKAAKKVGQFSEDDFIGP